MGLTITKEQIAELPVEKFNGKIVVIDHEEEIPDALHYLSSQPALGFDTETKPVSYTHLTLPTNREV